MSDPRAHLAGLTPYQRFSLLLAGALLLGSVALSVTIATIIERFVADETAMQTTREVKEHYPTIFGDSIFRRPFSPDEQARFDRTVRFHLDVYDIVRVRMFRPDGTIVHSYDRSVVGSSAFHGPDAPVARRAAAGEVSYEMTRGSVARAPAAPAATPAATAAADDPHAGHAAAPRPEPTAAGGEPVGEVMRLWVPVQGPEGVVGVAQVDRNVTRMVQAVRQMQLLTSGLVVLGAVLLFLALRRFYADATARLRAREAAERSARVQVAALEELARLKDEFVSQVSHELRGPIAPIIGYADLLIENDAAPDQVRRYARQIQEGGERLQRLVDDLLDLTRLESGRYRLERRPVDLAALLERSIRELRQVSTRHELRLEVPSPLPPVDADPDRVEQIVTNLITNAIRYSPNGGEVVVRAVAREGTVVTSVADHGIGIPPDRLGRVFEKFYRVDNTVTRAVAGTGLGLAISQELVLAQNGRIWVESTPGVGSTFAFSLPTAEAAPAPANGELAGRAAVRP